MRTMVNITKALADGNRLRVLMALRGGELCVCQIVAMLRLAPSTVSKHMYLLRQAGLVEGRKDGRWVYYRLAGTGADEAAREAVRWAQRHLADDPQIVQDVKTLKAILKMSPEELCGARCEE
ncbi:MAG: winged helix-turn-helix transcriptional regulator [Sedimentisphaerales bacterium]|nr:winged helix-turn-helix transcriptional regulator [Sedimentisphaerales bacterium]